ncbi:hypothetical protein BMQ_pBM50022 (plasmid) [Priestia megaterium QM B1551]|uniref:Uncharacterized protein n=1 Tax=Priestia megaterium (strain ATCC 12872 / QMB1551) TaxID=545693 RepID=D5E3I6_PRIM1|nr:hypothetical protein BMQ_pBM50022 [Priestia megaterium QM B1551]
MTEIFIFYYLRKKHSPFNQMNANENHFPIALEKFTHDYKEQFL